jgi:hypothetical protein
MASEAIGASRLALRVLGSCRVSGITVKLLQSVSRALVLLCGRDLREADAAAAFAAEHGEGLLSPDAASAGSELGLSAGDVELDLSDAVLNKVTEALATPLGSLSSAPTEVMRQPLLELIRAVRDSVMGMRAGTTDVSGFLVPGGSVLWGNGRDKNAIWSPAELLAVVAFPGASYRDNGLGPRKAG